MDLNEIKKQLPHLGKKQEDGFIQVGCEGCKILALPFDYQSFKSKIYNSEEDCASALLGVSMPNHIHVFFEKNSNTADAVYFICLFLEVKSLFSEIWDMGTDVKYIKDTSSLKKHQSLIKTDSIGLIDRIALPREIVPTQGLFFQIGIKYETLPFLKWAKQNGFPIPEELAFYEKIDGSLSWADVKPETISAPRAFVLQGTKWKVSFDGEDCFIDDKKPIRYMLEALKKPGRVLNYFDIIKIFSSRIDIDPLYSNMTNDQLTIEGIVKDDYEFNDLAKNDIDDLFSVVEDFYRKAKSGTEKQKEEYQQAKNHIEEVYGISVFEKDGKLKMGRKKSQGDFKNATNLISTARINFLNDFKKSSNNLYQHFAQYLKMDKGLLYDPPGQSPSWVIQN